MKKYYLFLMAFAAVAFSACNGNDPKMDPEGTTYPRMQLIEHFTGADCGYCPAGMDYIYDVYSQNPDQYVWVSNHYGYGTDEYTVAGSSTIGKALSVNGAPSISLNRMRYSLDGSASRSYHPYYIAQLAPKQETTATEMIELTTNYNAEDYLLHVTVKGRTSNPELIGVKLTVAVTESGMQGEQADYYGTWEGWKKFTHTHAVRVYVTEAMGDSAVFEKGQFTAEFDVDFLNKKWNPNNCEVVAWITALGTKYPVLNAAKTPVVAGTQGGEDIKHGGVEANPVADTYPESGSPVQDTIVFDSASANYYPTTNGTIMVVTAADLNNALMQVSGYGMYPYVEFYLYLESGATTIAPAVYNVAEPANASYGNVIAGLRDDELHKLAYSNFYYVYSSSGSLYPYKQWLIKQGNVTFTDGGFVMDVTTVNGSSIKAKYSGTIVPTKGQSSSPRRVAACGEGQPGRSLLLQGPMAF